MMRIKHFFSSQQVTCAQWIASINHQIRLFLLEEIFTLHILHFLEHLFNNHKATLPEGGRIKINVKRGQQLIR